MHTLIGFAGYKESGKDSAASFAIEEHGFYRVAFADVLKRVAEAVNPVVGHLGNKPIHLCEYLEWVGWDWDYAKKLVPVRQHLQNLGVAIRTESPNFWVDAAGVEKALDDHQEVVITDVRFPNEVEHIEALGGTVIRIVRPGKTGDGHISETALDGYVLPEIENDGTLEDLGHKVSALVLSLRGLAS